MVNAELKVFLEQLEKDYKISFEEKDKQSLFYIIQMIDLMYSELCYEVYDKGILYDLVYNIFKKNIEIIFDNLRRYSIKVSTSSRKSFEEIIKISTSNRYVELKNLNNLYNNFSVEVSNNLQIKNKIVALVEANTDVLKGQLFSKCVVNNRTKSEEIIGIYTKLIISEMIKNVTHKKDFLLKLYKDFIDSILQELYANKDTVKEKNLKLITHTAFLTLKEKEYININKYTDIISKTINDTFENLEKNLENDLGIKKKSQNKINPVKDYLLGFTNTIDNKIKKVFDEMNLIVTYDKEEVDEKIKEFNDLITHIYEIRLVFDKQYIEYKKEFNLISKDIDKFNTVFEKECSKLTESIKTNISNIFRDNIKIYNDIVYRTMLLKSKIHEYNTELSVDKIKDLLLK